VITEDQIVELYAKSNPVPRLDHLDPVESFDTVSLRPRRDRSSNVFDTKQIETKRPAPDRRRWVAGLAVLVLAAIVAVPLLMRDDGGRPVAGTTTIPVVPTELLPWDEDPSGVHLQVTVPSGWSKHPDDGFVTKRGTGGLMAFGGAAVFNVYTDRCNWIGTELDTGSTVDDLAAAFATVWGSDASSPTDVTFGGYAGKQMVLTVPTDASFGSCDQAKYVVWGGPGADPDRWVQGPGQILRLWILDIEGRRIVIEASHFPEASASDQAELQQMIDSLQIEP
jgi:hypothetical protein